MFFKRSALAEALALGDLVGVDVDLVTVTVAFVAAAFVEITILTISAYTVITHDSFLLKNRWINQFCGLCNVVAGLELLDSFIQFLVQYIRQFDTGNIFVLAGAAVPFVDGPSALVDCLAVRFGDAAI